MGNETKIKDKVMSFLAKMDPKSKKIWGIGIVALLGMILCIFGCKQDYKNPKAFINKYLVDEFLMKKNPPELIKALKLKGPYISNVKESVNGFYYSVKAKIEYIPKSKDTIYVDYYDKNSSYAKARVISSKSLKYNLCSEVNIARAQTESGLFVPINELSDSIMITPSLRSLEILDTDKIEKEFANLVDGLETPNYLQAIKMFPWYADNGQLPYVKDRKRLQIFADAVAMIRYFCAQKIDGDIAEQFGRYECSQLDSVSQMLERRGINAKDPVPELLSNGVTSCAGLLTSINKANMDRVDKGLPLLWPKTAKSASKNSTDISGKAFVGSSIYSNASIYFRMLLDIKCDNRGYLIKGSDPYIKDVYEHDVLHKNQALWSVAMDDGNWAWLAKDTPILISSNFDCRYLNSLNVKSDDQVLPIGSSPIFGNGGIVVAYKSGETKYFTADKVTIRNICGRSGRNVADFYLTPNGVIATRQIINR